MPRQACWVEGAMDADADFTLENIPFGIVSTASWPEAHVAVAIGRFACNLKALVEHPDFCQLCLPSVSGLRAALSQPTLNTFAALGRAVHSEVRASLQAVFTRGHPKSMQGNDKFCQAVLEPLDQVKVHRPMHIGDYTDFYAGSIHARAVGTMFRGPENALQPNYKHLPVGYHGRASSIVVSGTPIRRPWGQTITDPKAPHRPDTRPSRKLDYEAELGCFISRPNQLGEPIGIKNAEDFIFGYVLLNDWSARDIQTWEYVPLGPFNGKNFATTISPWVVLHEALEPFMVQGEPNDTHLQPYLVEPRPNNVFDISLQIDIQCPDIDDGKNVELTRTNAKHLIWSFPQMIAHHTVGGCPLQTGDLLGSGTISSVSVSGNGGGSLLELTENGKKPFGPAAVGFLDDGMTVTFRGFAFDEEKGRVGFGECQGQILSALSQEDLGW